MTVRPPLAFGRELDDGHSTISSPSGGVVLYAEVGEDEGSCERSGTVLRVPDAEGRVPSGLESSAVRPVT